MLPATLPRLLAFDLDGTLLPDGAQEADALTLQALARLRAAGCQVALITGRDRLPPGLHGATQPAAVATSNGGRIEIGGRLHREVQFSETELRAVLAHRLGAARVAVFTADEVFIDCPPGVPAPQWIARRAARPLSEAPMQGIIKVNFYHPEVARWRDHLRGEYGHLVYTGAQPPYDHFLTVTPQGADKGAALELLSQELSIPLSDVMAFGDSDNDLAMLLLAGYAVQVGDLPLLRGQTHTQVTRQEDLGAYLLRLAALATQSVE